MRTPAPVTSRTFTYVLLTLLTLVLPARLWAGSAAPEDAIFEPEQITTFAKQVERFAASNGARAFIIARQGRPEDELPEGIQFTHTAIAIYSTITLENGKTAKGYAIHNLYQQADKVDRSELVVDYPVDFFWSAKSLKAGVLIPTPALQQKLIALVMSDKDEQLHNPKYSAISNPFNAVLQNCTEYTLDILNAAIYDTTDTQRLKANAKAHFTPTEVKENPMKIALGSVVKADISIRDHTDTIATATFTSIAGYLNENALSTLAVTFEGEDNVTPLL